MKDSKKEPPLKKAAVFYVASDLVEELVVAVFDDGLPGDQTDEGAVVIHHGDEILMGCPLHQILHGSGDAHRQIVLAAGDLHDPPGLRLAHIHCAHILQRPEKVALGEGAPVLAPAAENGDGGVTGGFHLFQGLPDRIIIIYHFAHGFRCQKKQNIIHRVLLYGSRLRGILPSIPLYHILWRKI